MIPTIGHARSIAEDKVRAEAAPSALTVSSSATIASDYRFRGKSQSDQEMAVQDGITIADESGFCLGRWASNRALWGTFGGANMELDLLGGHKATRSITKAHVGHSRGQSGLDPNATAVSPTGEDWDWSLGVDATWESPTFNVSHVDTDITNREASYLRPSFGKGRDGTGNIAGSTVLASLIAAA